MPDQSSNLLLVEGVDDEHVVSHICQRSGQMVAFQITQKGSVDSLLKSIRQEARKPNLSALGIMADADDNVIDRWKAITDKLPFKVNIPSKPESTGIIINSSPRIGIWLMPDNISPGELEDFVEQMIPHNDPVWPLSRTYIDGIPQEDRMFTNGKILRAKVHAWLATRREPRRMGSAIRANDLNINVPVATNFVTWLRRLFI